MSTSVWGIDHGDEVSKAFGPVSFKPLLGAKPNKEVQNGLKMVQGMPKPQGVPKPPTNAVPGAKARQQFGGPASQQYGIKKNQEQVMGTSVWGVEHGPDEVRKDDYNPKQSYRKQGMAFSAPGARRRTARVARREAGLYSPRATNRKANWKQIGHSAGVGAAVGAAPGALLGAARGGPRGAVLGASTGAQLGAYGGSFHAQYKIGQRAATKAAQTGIANGDIKTGLKRNQITAFNGERKNRS